MRKPVASLALALLAWPATTSAGGAPARLPAVVPFELTGSTVLVPVHVNGSERKWFILDTGANSCVLADGLAKALKLVPQASAEGTGAGAGPVPYLRYARESALFDIDGVEFRCDHVISLDLSNQPAILGRPIDGILGSDFISQYVVVMDYDSEVLQLHDPARFEYRGKGELLPLTFDKRLPYVAARLTVAGVPPAHRRLLLDSGSEDAVDDDLILNSTGPHREVTGGVGLGQPYRVTFGWVDHLELGRFQLDHLPSVAPGVALIGGEVLRRFRVVLDYSRSRLILEPGAHFADAYRGDRSGLELRLAPAEDVLIVQEVQSGSAGAAAGLKPGDRLLAVDGAPVSSLGLRRVQRMLTIPGADYRLRVRRAGTIQEVELRIDSAE
jgi:hypothetical protein